MKELWALGAYCSHAHSNFWTSFGDSVNKTYPSKTLIQLTGQASAASWLHPTSFNSVFFGFDFVCPLTSVITQLSGQTDAQAPQPMHPF